MKLSKALMSVPFNITSKLATSMSKSYPLKILQFSLTRNVIDRSNKVDERPHCILADFCKQIMATPVPSSDPCYLPQTSNIATFPNQSMLNPTEVTAFKKQVRM